MSKPVSTTTARRSIRTRYKGTEFRSKLEADWARAFDALGIPWQYEPYGRYFGDQFYLVDFYLTRSRQWVEVKGVFEPDDCRKVASFLTHIEARPHTSDDCPDIALIACEPNGVFRGWERGACSADASLLDLSLRACHSICLFACKWCGGWWFADEAMGWTCQCCGRGDGDHHLADTVTSPLPGFPDLTGIRSLGHHE